MKRLEDSLKDHFDHFQPEVDPAVWQQLSRKLPGGSAQPSAEIKSLFSIAGSKVALIAGGLVAVVTAGVLLYRVLVSENPDRPLAPSNANEQAIQKPDLPIENTRQSDANVTQPAEPAGGKIPVLGTDTDQHSNQHLSIIDGTQENKANDTPAGQTALTGQTEPVKGGGIPLPPAPVEPRKPTSNPTQPISNATTPTPQESGKNAVSANKPILILSSNRGFAPLTITFMTNLEGQTADFDFGDGNATYGKLSTTHRYEKSGIFEVSCTISGQELHATVNVTGRIPTAFSPNGDGVNDRFTIDNPERTLIDLRIFSRSGQLVFSGKGDDVSWDGRLPSGDPAPEGTYLVHILAPSFEGAIHQQKATIQLFR